MVYYDQMHIYNLNQGITRSKINTSPMLSYRLWKTIKNKVMKEKFNLIDLVLTFSGAFAVIVLILIVFKFV